MSTTGKVFIKVLLLNLIVALFLTWLIELPLVGFFITWGICTVIGYNGFVKDKARDNLANMYDQ